jgi:hypothetical protein
MRPGFFLLAIGLASLLGAGVAAAGTLVQFPNLPGQTPAKLVGYLARPDTGLSLIVGSGSADSTPSGGGRAAWLQRLLQPFRRDRRSARLLGLCRVDRRQLRFAWHRQRLRP